MLFHDNTFCRPREEAACGCAGILVRNLALSPLHPPPLVLSPLVIHGPQQHVLVLGPRSTLSSEPALGPLLTSSPSSVLSPQNWLPSTPRSLPELEPMRLFLLTTHTVSAHFWSIDKFTLLFECLFLVIFLQILSFFATWLKTMLKLALLSCPDWCPFYYFPLSLFPLHLSFTHIYICKCLHTYM